jgi:hypothetical protein
LLFCSSKALNPVILVNALFSNLPAKTCSHLYMNKNVSRVMLILRCSYICFILLYWPYPNYWGVSQKKKQITEVSYLAVWFQY